MAYSIIAQNNSTTTLADENGNVITVPARVTLATSTDYTITKVNNNSVDLVDGNGKVIRGVPACVVLAGGGGGDSHNKGYFATQAALEEAHPTAEAGDYAIVGATDTVWVWDEDTSVWKDSDTKGQVTSVNGQTGDVTLSIPDAVQYSTMPTASADNLGDIVQFTGTTDATYTNGYFYKCVSDGQNPATYSWEEVSLGGASYTAGNGISIDTNNEISVAAPTLVNVSGVNTSINVNPTQATTPQYSECVTIGVATGSGANKATVIGYNSNGLEQQTVCVGTSTQAREYGVSVGSGAGGFNACGKRSILVGFAASGNANSTDTIAIGFCANATGKNAIQLGGNGTTTGPTNSDANTFKVANANGNFEIMNANGNLPADRLASTTGLADGNYRLRLTMASGVATLSWVAE